ncbi:DUF4345 domain-containing protein [Saccharothrix sp. NRRL B-16314]|uniref:DUF4345 domain-containing protein n=1 Tax=Saccharothrix sp. NRRL B-16314 TaxID=1463825 RepID=UPI000525C1F3|nr:DUF4345 domain-containing protein [Saccharothrix sp. NRRL B-16314]
MPAMPKALLSASGLVLAVIGAVSLFAPVAFHAVNGIDAAGDPSLLSELRAAGGALLAIGSVVLLGAFVPRLTPTAAALGALLHLSYGLSRLLGMAVDGMPSAGLVTAAAVELLLGLGCAGVLVRLRRTGAAGAVPGGSVGGVR